MRVILHAAKNAKIHVFLHASKKAEMRIICDAVKNAKMRVILHAAKHAKMRVIFHQAKNAKMRECKDVCYLSCFAAFRQPRCMCFFASLLRAHASWPHGHLASLMGSWAHRLGVSWPRGLAGLTGSWAHGLMAPWPHALMASRMGSWAHGLMRLQTPEQPNLCGRLGAPNEAANKAANKAANIAAKAATSGPARCVAPRPAASLIGSLPQSWS